MAISLVQHPSNSISGAGSTLTVTCSATAAGADMVVAVVHFSASTLSVTDSNGNTYVSRVVNNQANAHTEIFGLLNRPAGITSVTITFSPALSGSSAAAACVLEYSGVSGFGQIAAATTTSGTASGSVAIQAANNFVVSAFWMPGNSTYTATNGTAEMNIPNVNGNALTGVVSDNSGGSIGSTVTNSGTVSPSAQWVSCSLELSTIPINFVQSVTAFAFPNASTVSATLPFSSVAGNTMLVVGRQGVGPGDVISISDNNSNNYVEDRFQTIATDGDACGLFRASVIAASPNNPIQVTLTISSGSGSLRFIAAEYSGMRSTPLDKTNSANNTSNALNSGNVTPSVFGEMIIGAGILSNTAQSISSAGAGFQMMAKETDNSTDVLSLEQQYVTSTAPIAATFSLDVSQEWACIVAAYLQPAALQFEDDSQMFSVLPQQPSKVAVFS